MSLVNSLKTTGTNLQYKLLLVNANYLCNDLISCHIHVKTNRCSLWSCLLPNSTEAVILGIKSFRFQLWVEHWLKQMTSVPIDHPKFQECATVKNTVLICWLIYFGGKVCFPSYSYLEYNRHLLNHEIDSDFLAVSAKSKCHLRRVFFLFTCLV